MADRGTPPRADTRGASPPAAGPTAAMPFGPGSVASVPADASAGPGPAGGAADRPVGPPGEVVPHGRPSGLRSIGIRIVLPVLLASVALVGLGFVQTREAVAEATAAERAATLARLSSSAASLVRHVELEYAETNALRQRGGVAGSQLLTAARARTDAGRARFDEAADAARRAVPALGPAVRNADGALRLLSGARSLAPRSSDGSVELFDVYDQISERLIAVADAVPAQLNDPHLVESARSVVLLAQLEHLAAAQLDLVRRVFNRQRLEPGELVRLAGWEGAEQQRREELQRLTGPAKDRFAALVTGPDVARAARLRDAVLATDGGSAALRADPDVWYVAQSGLLRRLRIMSVELTTGMQDEARRIQSAANLRTAATAGLTVAVVGVALAAAVAMAVRTSRRLRRMRRSALALAGAELPAAVSRVATAADAGAVRGAMQESSARIDAVMAAGADEIGALSAAFGAVHRQALRLAGDQALLRMEVEEIFVALSRRGQSLAQRQLHLIDEFGRVERDPQRLARLYAIDHLAARMRRNEENLLVLAGGEPGRRFLSPVPVIDVIAASIEEVEDHGRIEVTGAPSVAVVAPAVGDVIHLLAELLENATSFSPPTTKVRVAARRTVETVVVTVFDEGIGMPPEKVAETNRRLVEASALTSTLVGTMGLLVVARLARRRGMQVRISSTPGGGTAATVTLPEGMLAAVEAVDNLRPDRWRGAEPWPGGAGPGPAGAVEPAQRPPYSTPIVPDGWSESVPAAPQVEAATAAGPAGGVPAAGLTGRNQSGAFGGVPSSSAPGGYTASGLPRRVVGPSPPPTNAAPGAPAGHKPVAGPPDPEAARARLSSLSTGIAAAGRRSSPATPSTPTQPS